MSEQSALDLQLNAIVQKSAHWFYWVAGLSLINTAVTLSGGNFVLLIGLGTSMMMDALAPQETLPLKILLIGFFAVMGYFATQGKKWAFIAGMVFYGLDAGLLVMMKSWLMVGFHVYVLYHLSLGLKALNAKGSLK